ncbi:MAG: hypothetical protein ACYDAY_11660 [Candidatus Dormibacteria bacterium]
MYGTVAHLKARPGTEEKLLSYDAGTAARRPAGYVASYIYRLEGRSDEYMLAVAFEDRDSYRRNAEDPKMDATYQELRDLLVEDPAWHDGEIIASRSGAAIG